MQRNLLEDETQLFQFGYADEKEFYSYEMGLPQPSAWNKFPTKEQPLTRYKFSSLEVWFGQDSLTINRQTYSALDWLGDIGGLLDSLYIIGAVFMSPFAYFTLQINLLTKMFRFRATNYEAQPRMRRSNVQKFAKSADADAHAMKRRSSGCLGVDDDLIVKSIQNDF